MAKKPIGKSVRLSEEVFNIISDTPGDGFNEKFENLVLDYHHTIEKRKKELEKIERKIKISSKHLEDLSQKSFEISVMITKFGQINDLLDSVRSNIKKVTQKISLEEPEESQIEIQKWKKAYENFMPKEKSKQEKNYNETRENYEIMKKLSEEGEEEDLYL